MVHLAADSAWVCQSPYLAGFLGTNLDPAHIENDWHPFSDLIPQWSSAL